MPKTLLLTPDFPPRRGGVALYLDAVASALKEEIYVLAAPEPDSAVFDAGASYSIERIELLFRWIWPHWFRSVLILCQRSAWYHRVIVSHVLPFGTAAFFAKLITKKPYVVIAHGMDVALARRSSWKKFLAGFVLRGAKLVIANSRALKEEIHGTWKVERVAFVHPAITLKGMAKEWNIEPIPHAGIRLLTVSRLVSRKGHLRVLEALARLRDRHQLPEGLEYLIVGDGPMSDAIEMRATDLGIDDLVHFRRGVSDEALPELYRSSDVFVMPTVASGADREGFGIVYLEAGAYGLPCIGTRQPGVDEALLDGHTGLLIPDGDIEALTRALLKLSTDGALRRTLGIAGQERVRNEFSRGKQAEKFRNLL